VTEFGAVTCAGCGLLCDDVTVEVSDRAVRLSPECPLGAQWFSERLRRHGEAQATVGGEAADVDTALARAAELLRGARRPLVRGFDNATVEDARAAVAIADYLGTVIDCGDGDWSGAPAMPLRGSSTATLGEIRDRSRVVVIWRENPETTHPRLLERLGLRAGGQRTLVVVDEADTPTTERAGFRLRWPRERDLEALTALHTLQQGLPIHAGELGAPLGELLGLLRAAPHVAFVYGAGLTAGAGGQRRALALHEFIRAVNHERHAVTLELPDAPGLRSADDVLAWQSGYSGMVDFAGGHPELVTATQPLQDVDVTLLVEAGREAAAEIAFGSCAAGPDVEVWIRTAPAGIEASGTMHRLDGVPLTLQAPLGGEALTAAALLTRLLAQVKR
jgi:formylmethanofuran dehydrogenase subunit B